MSRQQDLFEMRTIVGASVQLAGNNLQNPVEELTWEQVENIRKEITSVKKNVIDYLVNLEDFIIQGSPDWTKQWELAEELYEPFKEDYDPNAIDQEALKAEFIEKGLNPTLAEQMVISIADVSYDRYGDKG